MLNISLLDWLLVSAEEIFEQQMNLNSRKVPGPYSEAQISLNSSGAL